MRNPRRGDEGHAAGGARRKEGRSDPPPSILKTVNLVKLILLRCPLLSWEVLASFLIARCTCAGGVSVAGCLLHLHLISLSNYTCISSTSRATPASHQPLGLHLRPISLSDYTCVSSDSRTTPASHQLLGLHLRLINLSDYTCVSSTAPPPHHHLDTRTPRTL